MPRVSQCHTTLRWDPALKAKEVTKAGKQAIVTAGLYWKANYLELHFQEFSGAKYGYPLRTREYMKRKVAEKGHKRYLVWSGDLEAAAKAARAEAVGDSHKVRAKVVFRGGLPQRRLEIFTTVAAERRVLQSIIARHLTQFFRQRCPAKPLHMMGA